MNLRKSKIKRKPQYPKRSTAWEQNNQLEAYVNSALFSFGLVLKAIKARLTYFSQRFQLSWKASFFFFVSSFGLSCFTIGLIFMTLLSLHPLDLANRNLQNPTQISAIFYDRTGEQIGRRGDWRTDPIPIDEMPNYFIQAVLATEDRRFFDHFGVDFIGLGRAIVANAQAQRVVQGGSTITQQLAKNVFLSSEKTIMRKVNEAFISIWFEARYTKAEILRMYFDRVQMGAGVVGVDAAAEFYFGKSIKDISLAEAAILAGMFKAPYRYAPHKNLPRARARANEVLSNLVEAGYMTEGQVYSARINPAKAIKRSKTEKGNIDYFLDHAYLELQDLIPEGQYTVKVNTSADLTMQHMAQESMQHAFREFSEQYDFDEGAMIAADANGAIRALIGGKNYASSQFNRATQALRQPGSAFKPIVYATALNEGYKRLDRENDRAITIGRYTPKNYYNGSKGRVTLQAALAISINTIPVALTHRIGRLKVVEMAESLGVKTPIRHKGNPSLPLGSSEATVLDMANVYNVFLNDGMKTPLYAVEEIYNLDGKIIYDKNEKSEQKPKERVIPSSVAQDMNIMMHNVIYGGTARRAQIEGLPTSGKTGTTTANKDGWFVGYSGNMVSAFWFGNDSTEPTNKISGGNVPAMTWQSFMAQAHQTIPTWKPIPGVDFKIQRAEINEVVNQLSTEQSDDNIIADSPAQSFISYLTPNMANNINALQDSIVITRNKAHYLQQKYHRQKIKSPAIFSTLKAQ